MWDDPIVEEVHRIRKEIAADYDFDMDAYFADVQRRQVALGDRLVTRAERSRSRAAAGLDSNVQSQPPDPPAEDSAAWHRHVAAAP